MRAIQKWNWRNEEQTSNDGEMLEMMVVQSRHHEIRHSFRLQIQLLGATMYNGSFGFLLPNVAFLNQSVVIEIDWQYVDSSVQQLHENCPMITIPPINWAADENVLSTSTTGTNRWESNHSVHIFLIFPLISTSQAIRNCDCSLLSNIFAPSVYECCEVVAAPSLVIEFMWFRCQMMQFNSMVIW